MKVKIFDVKGNTELRINLWLEQNKDIHIHYCFATGDSADLFGMLYIFYDINDKYSELVSAIRGEK